MIQKISPCLWFDNQAEEAVNLYVSIFKNTKIGNITHYGEEGAKVSGRPKGSVMTVTFQLDGQEFMALNGGPQFKFTEAVSFIVNCKSQEEINELWEKLSAEGQKGPCGWLKDKYGLSWQIVPTVLGEMMQDQDSEKTNSVMSAILQMNRIEIKRLHHGLYTTISPHYALAMVTTSDSGTTCGRDPLRNELFKHGTIQVMPGSD